MRENGQNCRTASFLDVILPWISIYFNIFQCERQHRDRGSIPGSFPDELHRVRWLEGVGSLWNDAREFVIGFLNL